VVTDSAGNVVKALEYDAFGVRTADSAPTFDLPIGFAGGLEDRATSLVRFGLRDYDPATGRWTARDPILQSGGLNLYVYAGNRPVSHRDLSGLDEGGPGFFQSVVNAVSEFFTSDAGSTAVEVVGSLESDSPIVEGAGTLSEGLDKLETAEKVAETALEVSEALDEPSTAEQAAGIFKACIKWLEDIQPIPLTPAEAVEETFDRGLEHAREQRDMGTIHARQSAEQISQIEGWPY
jgi:RHS repeat-associated protein